jgi:zinc protease
MTRTDLSLALLLVALLAAPGTAAQRAKAPKPGKPGAQAPVVIDPPASPDGFDLPAYTRLVLPNGLVLLLMEQNELPIVSMRLTVRSGAADDPKGKEGLATLAAELLTTGTATRTSQQIANEVDFVGGTLAASAGPDVTTVTSEFLEKDLAKQIELLADVTLNAAFTPAEVDRIRQQRLAELAALPENPRAYADAQFESAVYAGTSYGHPAAGMHKSVTAITRDDVVAFYQANYAPNNAVLAVVGAIKTDDMTARLTEAFGGWTRRDVKHAPAAAAPAVSGRKVVLVDYPDLTQSQVRIGAPAIARNDPDYFALQVANTALGVGFSSRLVDEIRVNRSLTYNISSRFDARLRPGAFVISTFTKNATTREIVDATLAVVKKFRDEPMSQAEVDHAKSSLLGRFPQTLETPAGLATMISTIEVYDLPKDYVETFAARVRALTPADVTAAVRKRVPYDDVLILLFTNLSNTRGQLDGLGTIETANYLQ